MHKYSLIDSYHLCHLENIILIHSCHIHNKLFMKVVNTKIQCSVAETKAAELFIHSYRSIVSTSNLVVLTALHVFYEITTQ